MKLAKFVHKKTGKDDADAPDYVKINPEVEFLVLLAC